MSNKQVIPSWKQAAPAAETVQVPEQLPVAEPPAAETPVVKAPAPEETESPKEETVTVTVPKDFKLRLDDHVEKKYSAGVQEMPLAHAEHWYSKANGVTIYSKD